MGMKKTTSLKASFWKFLCMLLIGLIGAVAIPFSLILAGTSTGLITYANYSERITKNLAPVIAATPDLADVQLPMGCKYLVLDKNYQVTETTLEGDDLDRAMEYAISGKINTNLNKQYLLVTRENEYVVLQYYIGSQFTNEWLYEHFPFFIYGCQLPDISNPFSKPTIRYGICQNRVIVALIGKSCYVFRIQITLFFVTGIFFDFIL
jgi:two-component system, OmpR family, lantibiotic biosynthesis sensor histidine kinase NisK/SpaK